MNIYIRNQSLPELKNFSREERNRLLKEIEPSWQEVVGFFVVIAIGYLASQEAGFAVYSFTEIRWLAISIGALVAGSSIFLYEVAILNISTRKKLQQRLKTNNDN